MYILLVSKLYIVKKNELETIYNWDLLLANL